MQAKDSRLEQEFAMITVSDSLGLPRPGDSLAAQRAQEAWPNFLKELLQPGGGLHWHLGFGGNRAPEIVRYSSRSAHYLRLSGLKLVVAQFGIVDCTPRPIPLLLFQLLIRLRLQRIEGRLRRSRVAYRLWGRPWTTLKRFRKAALEFTTQWNNDNCQVVFIAIIPPGPQLANIVGKDFRVEKYNKVLRDLSDEIPSVHFVRLAPELLKDGHHLSKAGNIEVAERLHQFVVSEEFQRNFSGP